MPYILLQMKRIFFSILSVGTIVSAFAIPAKPVYIDYVQPDGTVIKVKKMGDAHGHVLYSEEGLVLIESNGKLEYARFDSSGQAYASGKTAGDRHLSAVERRALQTPEEIGKWAEMVDLNRTRRNLNLTSLSTRSADSTEDDSEGDVNIQDRLVPENYGLCSSTFPVMGEQKGLVILVAYQDVGFKYGDFDYFNRMLNEEGFSDNGSLGSARDWFIENSGGLFLPDFDVYGPVVLPENLDYYGGNDFFGNDKRPEEMAIHACQILDEEVDFSQYDRDGDGKIDNVFIFYAGKGEHDSNVANAVWPHSWEISASEHDEDYIFDGVQLDHYACTCEYPSGYMRPDGIGTFVHEFSHVMGLHALYVNTYSGGFTPGEWSVLDTGPYNNNGLTPPNYSSFEKCALGWIEMLPLEEGMVTLPELSGSHVAYAVPTDKENEFFFIENRQQSGNDTFIPGHGMLVWHIDYSESAWNYNSVNNNSAHQRVDIVEADNRKTATTRSGDSFPGAAGVTEFRCDVEPKFQTWSRKPLEFDLMEISESEDGVISFLAMTHEDAHGKNEDAAVEIVVNDHDAPYYDLTGRKVTSPEKGIYIRNGKKVLVH